MSNEGLCMFVYLEEDDPCHVDDAAQLQLHQPAQLRLETNWFISRGFLNNNLRIF